jgi:hypothetical protein
LWAFLLPALATPAQWAKIQGFTGKRTCTSYGHLTFPNAHSGVNLMLTFYAYSKEAFSQLPISICNELDQFKLHSYVSLSFLPQCQPQNVNVLLLSYVAKKYFKNKKRLGELPSEENFICIP